ncbi:MAG: hypothetical protein LIP09_04825 [Bacteroidales bacterium]|nr:hypothetical protein [Bacteroidales bacterium]
MNDFKINVEVVTPAVAAEYLKLNHPNNRPINKGQVAFYANEMTNGNWDLNGEPIKFDTDGILIDGQHRLSACVYANAPFETVVVRNAPKRSFLTIDRGILRHAGQMFSMSGVPNANNVSSYVKGYLTMKRGTYGSMDSIFSGRINKGSYSSKKVSIKDLVSEYNSRPEYWQNLHATIMPLYNHRRMMMPSEIGTIVAYLNLEKKYDFSFVIDFFTQLFIEESTKLNVIKNMRDKLINDKMSKTSKLTSQKRTQLLIKCWNAYKKNRDLKSLSWDIDKDGVKYFE